MKVKGIYPTLLWARLGGEQFCGTVEQQGELVSKVNDTVCSGRGNNTSREAAAQEDQEATPSSRH